MKSKYREEHKDDPQLNNCPTAMTVFAIGNELYFSSSVKGVGVGDNNHEFMTTFLLENNLEGAGNPRANAARQLQTSMLQCQARQRDFVDPNEHNHNARCGEFPSIFLYLASQDDPSKIDPSQGKIITVGSGPSSDNWPPIYRPCPPTFKNSVREYGCHDWIQKFGIQRVFNRGSPQFAVDAEQKTDHIPLCGLSS